MPRMARLDSLKVTPEDIFYETARLLDFLLSTPDISQHQVDSLWNLMLLDIRKWKSDATDHDKRMVANTVFLLVRALLTQYYDTHFSETVCDLLENTIEHEWIGFGKQEDKDEYSEFSNRLVEQSPILSDWINQYDDADVWLSDQIAETLSNLEQKEVRAISKKKNARRKDYKPEKQHRVEYPVFSKGPGVTDNHIKALYKLLTTRNWISTQTSEAEFHRLFSGSSNDCEIIWMGPDELGSNEPTTLGISALYVLFKRMADECLIVIGNGSKRVGPILETHFVDVDGHFLSSVSNVNKTSSIANDYIGKILKLMKTRLSSDDIQRFLEKEMESKYDQYDTQDLRIHKRN